MSNLYGLNNTNIVEYCMLSAPMLEILDGNADT